MFTLLAQFVWRYGGEGSDGGNGRSVQNRWLRRWIPLDRSNTGRAQDRTSSVESAKVKVSLGFGRGSVSLWVCA